MKLIGFLITAIVLAMIAGCASTAQGPALVSPGVLSSQETLMDCPDMEDCDVICEMLPNGNCLVTCIQDGVIICQQECTPRECDPGDCDGERTIECEGIAPKDCVPMDCGS